MANRFVMLCCAVLGTLSVVGATSSGLRLHGNSHDVQADGSAARKRTDKEVTHPSITTAMQDVQVDQKMVICNAYASKESLAIVLVRTGQKITQGSPMNYKQCKEFSAPLKEGDQLQFKAGGLDIGSFYATGLPDYTTSLLLIPHRKSPSSVGITFESHAFANVKTPQIAVIDVFGGKIDNQAGAVKITEKLPAAGDADGDKMASEESLKFNTVVAVNPGRYDVSIVGTGLHSATLPLNAAGADTYVVMRLGNEGEGFEAAHYPQELVVFPNSAARQLAMGISVTLVVCMAAFLGLHGIN